MVRFTLSLTAFLFSRISLSPVAGAAPPSGTAVSVHTAAPPAVGHTCPKTTPHENKTYKFKIVKNKTLSLFHMKQRDGFHETEGHDALVDGIDSIPVDFIPPTDNVEIIHPNTGSYIQFADLFTSSDIDAAETSGPALTIVAQL